MPLCHGRAGSVPIREHCVQAAGPALCQPLPSIPGSPIPPAGQDPLGVCSKAPPAGEDASARTMRKPQGTNPVISLIRAAAQINPTAGS